MSLSKDARIRMVVAVTDEKVGNEICDAIDASEIDNPQEYSIPEQFYVNGDRGDDLVANGAINLPFKTIQACLDYVGQPTSLVDALRHIVINISGKSALPSALFSCIYTENLTVPNRFITLQGYGVKIDGDILKEYSSTRRFGASSSEFRPTLTCIGFSNCRDNHARIRNGFHIGGNCRTSILTRNFDSIQGDGSNKITVHIASGQHVYPITISTPAIRLTVRNTTNYNGTYDITAKIDSTTFQATRVSGTNANTAVETTGSFFECDSAGSSGITHDSHFINTYMQGAYTCDDGTVNGAAITAGSEILYATGCRFFTGIEGRAILLQRCENTTFAGTNTVSSIASMNNCSFAGSLALSSFSYSSDDMGFMNCRFNSAVPITVSGAGQTVRMDLTTFNSFQSTGGTWITNTPTLTLLGQPWEQGAWASRPTVNLISGQMYFDTSLKKPF